MTVAAVVCEYNPFHNGHLKQFRQIRGRFGEETPIVCIMSGDFVQRGQPAVFAKEVRAKAAVECGASLVLELPVTCALASAEGFAYGAAEILNRLGVVSHLCFGSECGDLQALTDTAAALERPDFGAALRRELEQRDSFAAARQRALAAIGVNGACLSRPNDILAVEYCKALLRLKSAIEPVTFTRAGSYHAQAPERENPSATSLRQLDSVSEWKDYVPEAALACYQDAVIYRQEHGERSVMAVLRRLPDEAFETVPFGSEGLWRRFRRACRQEAGVEQIIDAVKSKRYARSRIARMTMCAYLGLTEADMAAQPPYVRVLAMDERGRQVLAAARETADIPVIHAGQRVKDPYFDLEQRVESLHELFAPLDQPLQTVDSHKYRVFYKNK